MVQKFSKPTGPRAQTISEYTLLVMVITLAVVVVYPMVKRGTQSLIRTGADQIGLQNDAEQNFTSGEGYLIFSNAKTDMNSTSQVLLQPGAVSYVTTGNITSKTHSYSNAGFTAREYKDED